MTHGTRWDARASVALRKRILRQLVALLFKEGERLLPLEPYKLINRWRAMPSQCGSQESVLA